MKRGEHNTRRPRPRRMPSPLLGYNNNFRHKNRVFHIQTEDSGVKHPHIITHLFADGGRIIKSVKTSYAEYVGDPRMAEIVKEMMKQQHKAMIIALRDGRFDAVLDGGASPSKPPASGGGKEESAAAPAKAPSAAPGSLQPDTTRNPPELGLDMDALEHAAESVRGVVITSELPPPPDTLLRERRSSMIPPRESERPPGRTSSAPPPESVRYGNTRPAAIFTKGRPVPSEGLFGDDLASDKSLDDVILSYLAEDLEK